MQFRYIYGPVSSWRLGRSLGIDLLSWKSKVCNFNCVYCQLGPAAALTTRPKVLVKTSEVIAELKKLPKIKIDYITFSGRGEPCLARNLGEAIKAVKKMNIAPVAVLTNASLLNQAKIRKNLSLADFVIVKLDSCSQDMLERINRPEKGVRFKKIIQGIKKFQQGFKGKFALQMMFLKKNLDSAEKLAQLARVVNPDEVQINTPTRPSAEKSLSKNEIARIKSYFKGLNFISVYDIQPKKVASLSNKQTLRRRGKVI
ncbi:radical SAM protein [Candidatus Omnitrophota bacterium]